ncbi:hypothetical protein D4764_11G0005150 [Takifugu flavidus]|uniref:Uncharacterized protein n=1 Tax=Takifugu flavidus TaxID=433684 RepID=A0A5C6PF31_9TELE|nr:hypothetical protein D4764_11G0005150 [Takifugu flavidus]
MIRARFSTCPGLCNFSSSQGSWCQGTLGSSPAFHIQVQGQETGANSWRCAEGAWRLPQQMNHHGLIFNSRLLLPSSISLPPSSFHLSLSVLSPSEHPTHSRRNAREEQALSGDTPFIKVECVDGALVHTGRKVGQDYFCWLVPSEACVACVHICVCVCDEAWERVGMQTG